MKKVSSVVLTAFLFLSTLLFKTQNANAQTTFTLIYGGTYFVQNGYNNWEGGYLDTKGVGCEGKLPCISTANRSGRVNLQTRMWKIVSATGKQNGTAVLVNDEIYLQNLYLGGYLDTKGVGCKGNLVCVSTASSPNRANLQTRTWKIVSATGKQNGTAVLVNDEIYLQNLYPYRTGMLGGYLDIKGVGSSVSTAGTKERTTLGTSHWRFVETSKIKEEPQGFSSFRRIGGEGFPTCEKCNCPTYSIYIYTVKSGDTLFKIAETFYGDRNQWTRILYANPRIDPNNLQPGQRLEIPDLDEQDCFN
ncbi:LysM peptidoglycan-binding domain-containing protein [Nostoc sphaeroides CHAB 2801]|uniref:LysM peptidoglycan-binding domain-containing protein n=1 Tax=Nostoc sphaeroides TaxID=446679 RepID=UPI001E4D7C91|nr:LysM peptidoglycan-binding domain-containing protein [Nostoc sphaeroides]MCC5633702.1 LysM peptidoglycan-binding domain-containing protein [Nostoc sphaeroides CHAB 2801]